MMKELWMIGHGGRVKNRVGGVCPTLMAAFYCKSTWTSHPTPYVIEVKNESIGKCKSIQMQSEKSSTVP